MKFLLSALAAAVVALAGCGPADGPNPEKDYGKSRAPRAATAVDMISETGVVALVRDSASQDGPGTMSDWLDRKLKAETGQVMFPAWKAERRGATKFEVQYTFTLIDSANRIVKRGYAWTVDVPLSMVGPPRAIAPEYAPSATQRQDARRVLEAQSSLE